MAVKDFPQISEPDTAEWTLEYQTQSFKSDLNGISQDLELPGARWSASLQYTNRFGREARELAAFIGSLRGRAGRFWLTPSDWEPYGTALGSPSLSADVTSGETVIQTSGWGASQPEALAIGDFFELNGELKQVTQTVSSDGTGAAQVEFVPPQRVGISAGASLRLTEPRCLMKLDGDDFARRGLTPPLIYAFNFTAKEALDL